RRRPARAGTPAARAPRRGQSDPVMRSSASRVLAIGRPDDRPPRRGVVAAAAAVDDAYFPDAALERVEAGPEFCDHALARGAVGDHQARLLRLEPPTRTARGPAHPP